MIKKTKRMGVGMPRFVKNAFIDKIWHAQAVVDYNIPPSHVACEILRQMLTLYCRDKLFDDMRNYKRDFGAEALQHGFDGSNCILSFSITPELHLSIKNKAFLEGKKMTRMCLEIIVDYLNGKYNIRLNDELKISVVR
jgi:hypothetical protein